MRESSAEPDVEVEEACRQEPFGFSGLLGGATVDLRAEIDEQGLEGVCSMGLRRGDARRDSTSDSLGTTCPSDRGVGRRGGHRLNFAFCSPLVKSQAPS